MRGRIVAVIRVVAVGCVAVVLHAAVGVGANDRPAPPVLTLPGAALRATADQPQAAPGAGHGWLIDRHVAAGLTCAACHATMPARPVATTTCLGCHGGSYDRLAAMTAADDPNPHQSHQGAVPCAACHHVHVASENFCAQCHREFAFKVP